MNRRLSAAAFALVGALALALTANAQEQLLIHSDEPLWGFETADNVWPKHFANETEFGCSHPIALGDWQLLPRDEAADSEAWYRITNYGAFHCWMNVAEGDDRQDFGRSRPSFLVQLGKVGPIQLWALQIGALPGSDYVLLSSATDTGLIERFDVLQRKCSREQTRGGRPLDILRTTYCSINSRADLTALARQMVKLPTLGTLEIRRADGDK